MKIYYYHTLPVREAYNEWLENKHPGQLLYGLTHFDSLGVDCIFHRYKKEQNRIRMMIRNLKEILFCKEHFDILYATSFRGLELIIFLRALGLFRKPIALWHHTAVTSSPNVVKNWISKIFYLGFDHLFFFSNSLIELSLKTGKVKRDQVHLIHWGADLHFYDKILEVIKSVNEVYISTGKENRDFPTLINAFQNSKETLDLFVPKTNGNINYQQMLGAYTDLPENIHLQFVSGIIPYELAKKVAESAYVVICCKDLPYTLGLTTLVEAFALGKPVICSDNPFWEMDIVQEGVGIVVPYGDVNAWQKAIQFLTENKDAAKEMGKKGRELSEKTYNLEAFTKEIVEVLKKI